MNEKLRSLKLVKIKQTFDSSFIKDVKAQTVAEMEAFKGVVKKGSRIAIAVGSRGIDRINLIVKSIVGWLKAQGALPFIIPAMGSHGSGTAEGQAEILAEYGITEETMGVAIRSSMKVKVIPSQTAPCRLFMDQFAFDSDGVILVNRVKPHTDFKGVYESGLVKMAVIGLGKHAQAMENHSLGIPGLKEALEPAAAGLFKTGKILGGIAIVENANDRAKIIEGIPVSAIFRREPELLQIAKENMPSLPIDKLDVLLVDWIGKNISGVGLDTNIIGRMRIYGEREPLSPDIHSIVIDNLTTESHGNAVGIGLADVITRKLFNRIDFKAMYENGYTSTFLQRSMIPVIGENPLDALNYAFRQCCDPDINEVKMIRIKNTLALDELYVSSALWKELSKRSKVSFIEGPVALFDAKGDLTPF